MLRKFIHCKPDTWGVKPATAELNRLSLCIKLIGAGFEVWSWKNRDHLSVYGPPGEFELLCLRDPNAVEGFEIWESAFPNPVGSTLAQPVKFVSADQRGKTALAAVIEAIES